MIERESERDRREDVFRYHYSYLSKTRAQFVPPKPKLLDMARVNGPSFLLSVCSSPLLDIPLSNYEGIWNSHVGSLPLRISGTWHSIVRLTAVCRHPDKIHVCHVSPRSTREQRAHYLVHQLDSKTKQVAHYINLLSMSCTLRLVHELLDVCSRP